MKKILTPTLRKLAGLANSRLYAAASHVFHRWFPEDSQTQSPSKLTKDLNSLYRLLYHAVHDLDRSLPLATASTQQSFQHQWDKLKQGRFLLSDPWFRDNVTNILTEEEILLRPEWFKGKQVLDGGCGNGRWSYGFARLGANITAVDVSAVAVEETRRAIAEFPVEKRFFVHPLERLHEVVGDEKFDLVFSWGVIHHAESFNESLRQLLRCVKPDGVFYAYLYSRESLGWARDLELFKDRLYYNTLPTESEKLEFLMDKALGDPDRIHGLHDMYAPLINRRLEYSYVEKFLREAGFDDVVRTIDHTEIFIRAIRGNFDEYNRYWLLPPKRPPYWFQRP